MGKLSRGGVSGKNAFKFESY
jgi:hypothetical protein